MLTVILLYIFVFIPIQYKIQYYILNDNKKAHCVYACVCVRLSAFHMHINCDLEVNFEWLMIWQLKAHLTAKCFWHLPFSSATVNASTHQDHSIQKNPVWGLFPAGKVTYRSYAVTPSSLNSGKVCFYTHHCLVLLFM